MKVMEKNVMRLVAVQQLRAAYGIKTKNWNKNKAASCKPATSSSTKVFGVPLESLPYYNMECGSVPSFLVDACMKLRAHVDTEGLFRKSGSIVRLKALRAKLDAEVECLSTALPCDVAGLVKQFFRELPEPVLPAELQEAFLKAQQLPTEEERTSATMLLSCVLPDKNLAVLRYFFGFLHNVSQRSAENKMDSSNLSVILAPNLLHCGDGTEKMNASTERRLRLQAAVIHCFIENAGSFGVLPQLLQERVPAMMGCEAGAMSPTHHELEELDLNSGLKRKQRRSFGGVVSGALNKMKTNRTPTNVGQADSLVFSSATPVIATPSSKRKLPLESGHSFGFSNKKRRSVKKTLGIDLLPSTLFSGTSTPGSALSASGVLDASQNTLSSAGKSRRHSGVSSRRKSHRLSNRHAVSRVESGKAGCFSPKVSKKEAPAPRKSLRLRFSLGRSSRDSGSESIGMRLATQESTTSFPFSTEADFSLSVRPPKAESKSSKYMSKSEDNLLTPQYEPAAHRTSWCRETPGGDQVFTGGSFTDTPVGVRLKSSYASEPAIVPSEPPAASGRNIKLCCASSAESLEAEEPPRPPQKAFTQEACRSTGVMLVADSSSSAPSQQVVSAACRFTAQQQHSATFSPSAALSPLHIDSAVFDSELHFSPTSDDEGFHRAADSSRENSLVDQSEGESEPVSCSRLVDALDVQSPAHFKMGVSSGLQSTPFRLKLELVTPPKVHPEVSVAPCRGERSPEEGVQAPVSHPESEKRRVADHIHHFNRLTLYSPRGSGANQTRSPLKFQRTPVRQTVRRINSLLGDGCRPSRRSDCSQVTKATSLESGLSPLPQAALGRGKKKPPPVPPKKPSTMSRKAFGLGDVTNKTKTKEDCSGPDPPGAVKSLFQEKDMRHYRGSPRNPLHQARLLSATKPVDL